MTSGLKREQNMNCLPTKERPFGKESEKAVSDSRKAASDSETTHSERMQNSRLREKKSAEFVFRPENFAVVFFVFSQKTFG